MAEARNLVESLRRGVEVLGKKHDGAVQIGSKGLDSNVTDWIDTRCPMINYLIGGPGVPCGRITSFTGKEGSGKSTLGLHLLAETQARGGIGVLVDTERRLWRERAENLGVDMENIIHVQGATLEQDMKIIHALIEQMQAQNPKGLLCIVLDSVAGAQTERDSGSDYGDPTVGGHARVLNSGFRRIVPLLSASNTALVIINQLRHVIKFGGYGPAQMIQVAEKPIKHGATVSIELENEKYIGPEGKPPTGVRIRAIVRENRIAPTQGWKETFDIDYMTGVIWSDSALDVLLHIGAVGFNQGWFTYKGNKFRRRDFKKMLKDQPELVQLVKDSPYIHKLKEREE